MFNIQMVDRINTIEDGDYLKDLVWWAIVTWQGDCPEFVLVMLMGTYSIWEMMCWGDGDYPFVTSYEPHLQEWMN